MQPDRRSRWLLLLALAGSGAAAQELDWYRTEILIFARTDAESLSEEQWDPLPELSYPRNYRFLLDPVLADARLARAQAYASHLDLMGVQQLLVPAAEGAAEPVARPDSELEPALRPEDVFRPDALLALPMDGTDFPDGEPATDALPDTLPEDPNSLLVPEDEEAGPMELPALPYEQVPADQLELTRGARRLVAAGQTVLFHAAWWAPLGAADVMLPIALDRGADADQTTWPALQGSLHLYRSRYLHATVDLWLNTDGSYLPEGWSMPAPPLPRPSLMSMDRHGEGIDPFAEPRGLSELLDPAAAQEPVPMPPTQELRELNPRDGGGEQRRSPGNRSAPGPARSGTASDSRFPAVDQAASGDAAQDRADPASASSRDNEAAASETGEAADLDPILASVLAALDERDARNERAQRRAAYPRVVAKPESASKDLDSRSGGTSDPIASVAEASGEVVDTDLADTEAADIPGTPSAAMLDPASQAQTDAYGFRHAIVHRQSRRMRSGETHYLDHPVLGVMIRVTPADDDLRPVQALEHLEWRQRHGLPEELVPVEDANSPGGTQR